MDLHASLSRFYALPVAPAVAAAIAPDVAHVPLPDLVQAHLSRNPLCFGGIDKTLSGFVVLDDEDNHYSLLDLRGRRQVWRQNPETRDVELRFGNLTDYLAFRHRYGQQGDPDATLLAGYASEPAAQDRCVDSAVLLQRYQWLMQALAQPPHDHQGLALQSADQRIADAWNTHIRIFRNAGQEQQCFAQELPHLADDVHLALYWLLHTRLLGQHARLTQVLAAVGTPQAPLLQAFVAVFGDMADDADVADVPDFRHRRARLLIFAQIDAAAPLQQRLDAMAVSPRTVGVALLDELTQAMGTHPDAIDPVLALQALDRIQDRDAPAVWALRAFLQDRLGQPAHDAADQATRLLAATPLAPLHTVLALYPILRHIRDGHALQAIVTPLLEWDDLMLRVLDMLDHAQRLLGQPLMAADALAEQRRLAQDLLTLWDAPHFADSIATAEPATRDALAIRLARRPDLTKVDAECEWAIRYLLASDLPARNALLQRALPQLSLQRQQVLLPDICGSVADGGDALVPTLLRLLGGEPHTDDMVAEMASDDRADAILQGLHSLWGDDRLFEPLMAMLEQAPVKSVLVDRVAEAAGSLQAVMDTPQRQRLFHYALARTQAHADDYASPRILDTLRSPDMDATLRRALEAESIAMASGQPASEKVLSRLYMSLGHMATTSPGIAEYLVSRLWDEHASPARLYFALHTCWTPTLHAVAMQRLRERPSAAAAAIYCLSLLTWDKQPQPALEVAELALAWPLPEPAAERGLLNYVLLQGSALALPQYKPALARALYLRANSIDIPAYKAGTPTTAVFDPFSDPDLKAQLGAALDGTAEAEATELLARLQHARSNGQPDTTLPLTALGQLAGGEVAFLWFCDPTSGITLFQDVFGNAHYFDGYGVTAPPFQVQVCSRHDPSPGPFHDVTEVSERRMFWQNDTLLDWTRFGAVISAVHGENNAHEQVRLALRCQSAADATALLAMIGAHPLNAFVACDPWYRPKHGEVARMLHHPQRENRSTLGLRHQAWEDEHGTVLLGDHALAAIDAAEVAARRADGFTCRVHYLDDVKRPQDLSLLDWFSELGGQPAQTVAQALEQTLGTLDTYLAAHALAPAGGPLAVRRDGPAADADIDALRATRSHPLPDALLALWQQHASIGWHYPGNGMRLLSPGEVLAGTPLASRQPLVVDASGLPVWLLGDTDDACLQVVAARMDEEDRRGQQDAGEAVTEALLTPLLDGLSRDIADAALLWHGQRGDADIERLTLGNGRDTTLLRLDREARVLAICNGKRGQHDRIRFQHLRTPEKAAAAFDKARKVAEKSGQQAQETA